MTKHIKIFIDVLGKCLLLWFIFSTCIYFYSGRFIEEIKMIPNLLNWGVCNFVYSIIQIPVESIGVFVLIPFLLKGHLFGLFMGLIYWFMGYFINPLWYIVPRDLQVTPDGKASSILWAINILTSATYLVVIIAFYFYRRSLRKEIRAIPETTT